MQDSVNQRFRKLVKRKTFGNVKLFATEVGISPNTAASIASGQSESIRSSTLEMIAKKYPDVNLHWLITGQGEMTRNEGNMQINALEKSNSNTFSSSQSVGSSEVLDLRIKNFELEKENWELKKKIEELEKKK